MRWQNIICPVDFSEGSEHAVTAAADIAKKSDGKLTLLHVLAGAGHTFPGGFVDPELVAKSAAEEEAKLVEWTRAAETATGMAIHAVQVSGEPWEQIVKLATDSAADLIVMGTHGVTGLAHLLIGSVAERVVRHATCPVLVVRHRPDKT